MKNIKPYAKYKASGIAWLGDIPEHWEVRKAKKMFRERSEKGFENEPFLAATQEKGVVLKSMLKSKTVLVTKDFHTLKLVEEGDFVISLRSFQGGIEYAHYRGIISPAYTILNPSKMVERGFFRYYFKSKEFINCLTLLVTGIREGQNVDTGKFKDTFLPLPPLSEQTAIANFLDYKTAKIDRFIAKKKRLIKLLNEQKSAIINDAVTKGLNPNVKMKPSGIEWLGDIPEHWEVRRLKYLAKIKTGRTPKIESSLIDFFENAEINWFTPGDFKYDGILKDSKRKVNEFAIESNQVEIFPENTVYLIGIGGTIGKIGMSYLSASANQQINAIIFREKIYPEFGFYFLKNSKHQVDLLADFTTLPILNQAKTKEIIVGVPPITEQKNIVEYIKQETAQINTIIQTIEKEITLVQEYRTALIAEAVTGKIDVRDCEIAEVLEENTYEDWEEELNIAAEEEAEYHKQEME